MQQDSFRELLATKVKALETALRHAEAEYGRAEAAYQTAVADLQKLDEIQARYGSGSQEGPLATPPPTFTDGPQVLLEIAHDFDRRKAKSRSVLTENQVAEIERVVKPMLESMDKTAVLYLATVWILGLLTDGTGLTPREVVRNLPPSLRELYNSDETTATENVRARLRQQCRPPQEKSELQYKNGLFCLIPQAE